MAQLWLEISRLHCYIAANGSQILSTEEGSLRFTHKGCPLGIFLLILQVISKLGIKNQKTCYKTFCKTWRGNHTKTVGTGHFK